MILPALPAKPNIPATIKQDQPQPIPASVKDAEFRVIPNTGNPLRGIASIFLSDEMKIAWTIGFGMGAMVGLAIARMVL